MSLPPLGEVQPVADFSEIAVDRKANQSYIGRMAVIYQMKNLDQAFWRRVKMQAASDGLSVRTIIIRLLTNWLKQKERAL